MQIWRSLRCCTIQIDDRPAAFLEQHHRSDHSVSHHDRTANLVAESAENPIPTLGFVRVRIRSLLGYVRSAPDHIELGNLLQAFRT